MEKSTQILATTSTQAPTERCAELPKTPSATGPGSLGVPLTSQEDSLFGVERLERLGGGGFGEVWRVRYLGSEEAWKYIPIHPGSSERTGKEAVHARRVDHPNVVRVLDVLKLPDHYVLRMDLVRGKDFSRVINEEGVFPPDEAVAYGLQIASALAHAHRQGVVHLDLKPHNLILTNDAAKVMVTDFGISASLAQEWGDLPEAAGTPFFMAPEQFDTPPAVGSGIDVWSLAVTLYWSMSLSYPFKFDGREPREVIKKDPCIPLSEVVPYVPRELSAVLEKMLEKDPQKRPPSMEEVVRELEAFHAARLDPAERAGDRAFALSAFDEAIGHYEEASQRASPSGQPSRAAALLAAVREARAEHDAQVSRIRARVAEDDLAGALLTLNTARRRFSRSAVLKEERRMLEEGIKNLFGDPRRSVERDLRRARFAEARRYLDLLASLISIPGGRKVLRGAQGNEPILDAAAVERLRGSVEKRDETHRNLSTAIEGAVQELDFTRARDALEEFQNHFPLPQNLERMRTFALAAEALAFLADYPRDLLQRVRGREARATADKPLLLTQAESKGLDLLSAFNPETYPRFQEVREQVEELGQTIQALRARAGPVVEAIKKSHRKGDLVRVGRELEAAGDIILHTDIFNKEARDAVRDIQRQLQGLVERAERLYREGLECMERRQFNRAITAFEEALRVGDGNHPDIEPLIRSASESAEKRRRLAEDLHSLDLTMPASGPSFVDTAAYLEKAEELLALQEEPRGGETVTRSIQVLTSALEAAAREPPALYEKRIAALRELGAAVAHLKPRFLDLLLERGPEIYSRLELLVETCAQFLHGSLSEVKARLRSGSQEVLVVAIHELVEALSTLGPLLSSGTAAGGQHPCERVGEVISALARRARAAERRRTGKDLLAREALDLLAGLSGLAPPEVAERIKVLRRRTLEAVFRNRIADGARAALERGARFAVPFLMALAMAGAVVLVWSLSERRAGARLLHSAIQEARKDARWTAVDGLVGARGDELALALRKIGRDLPAFAALDHLSDPDARFWARCVAAAGLLSWISPEGTPVLGRGSIHKAIEETLSLDLAAAARAWVERAGQPFPGLKREPGKGLSALEDRLAVASQVLEALKAVENWRNDAPALAALQERLKGLRAAAGECLTLVGEAARLLDRLQAESDEAAAARLTEGFWDHYRERRESLRSAEWRALLWRETSIVLARGLRERPPWEARAWGGSRGPRLYLLLHLLARIREAAGPEPLEPGWSPATDPLHAVLEPLLR